MKKQRLCLIIAIVENLMVIYLGWKWPKKFCASSNFGQWNLKILLRWSKGVILIRYFLERCTCILLFYVISSLSIPSPSGGFISWHSTHLPLGVISISSWSSSTWWSGWMPCLRSWTPVRLQHYLYSIKLSQGSNCWGRLWLTMEVTFRTKWWWS